MKILTLLGLLVLLTTSPTTDCTQGQFIPPIPVAGYHSGPGSNFGFLALALIVFSILLLPSPTKPTTPPSPPSSRCPSGYTLYSDLCGQFCYRFDGENCKTWTDARTVCQGEGADLWVPDTCTYPFMQSLAVQDNGFCNDYWIGVFREPPSNDYKTLGGTIIPDSFQFWAVRQPRRGGQACVQITNELRFRMSDDFCTENAGYICQKSL